MLDLVGNPEDRFSHNEAHLNSASKSPTTRILFSKIMKLVHFLKVHIFTEIQLKCDIPGKVSMKSIPAKADRVGFIFACNVHV